MAPMTHEQTATASSSQLSGATSVRRGDHERLFQLLEQDGPAPADFMLGLSDPVIGRENIFEDEDDS
jgi:hypothetical protein